MNSKNNRALLLFYVKFCASFQIHRWIQTGVTVRNRSIWVKIDDILSHMTLKFDLRKQKGTSSKPHQALCVISNPSLTSNLSYSPETLNSGRNWLFFLSYPNLRWMTSKSNGAPLLYYINLCASFQSHGLIQTWITVRKRSIRIKMGNLLSHVTLKFDEWKK